jgi:predicted phosphohydrolase
MAKTITTRFLILSDTHSLDFDDVEKCGGKCRPPFPKADAILHCGDLTHIGGLDDLEKFVRMIGEMDAELKLVIAGNHDMTLDPNYWIAHGDDFTEEKHKQAKEIMTGPLAMEAGMTYLEEGLKIFTLKNGAKFTIFTSPYTPEFYDWGFPYPRHEDRYSNAAQADKASASTAVSPIPDHGTVDIVMTHGPPQFVLDQCANGNVGCEHLLRALHRCRPRLHCFGHIHEGHGAIKIEWDLGTVGRSVIKSETMQKNSYPEADCCQVEYGKETLMVNAAIMNNLNFSPANPPWLLDLEMPRAD